MSNLRRTVARRSHRQRKPGSRASDVVCATPHDRSVNTRNLIVSAARRLIRELGLARTTTKLIAQTAGVSEALIFKHFGQKNDLLLAALRGENSAIVVVSGRESAGTDEVRNHLKSSAQAALRYYQQNVPSIAASFADTTLLSEHRRWILDLQSGNQDIIYDRLSGYVAEEQRLGRIRTECESSVIAEMLLGPCFRRVFRHFFFGSKEAFPETQFLSDLVQALESAFVIPCPRRSSG